MDIFSKNVKVFAVEQNVMDSLTLSISTRELDMEEVKIFWNFSIILYLAFFPYNLVLLLWHSSTFHLFSLLVTFCPCSFI